jgi:hypothetical protein
MIERMVTTFILSALIGWPVFDRKIWPMTVGLTRDDAAICACAGSKACIVQMNQYS